MNNINNALNSIKEKYGKLSGEQLKMFALIFMILDHVGYRMMVSGNFDKSISLVRFGDVLRMFGRLAFPIFAFMISEGFRYTSDKRKYAMRLFVAAIFSEIPFDLLKNAGLKGYNGKYAWFDLSGQNVMLTFFLAVIMLILLDNYMMNKNTYYAYNEYVYVIVFCIIAYLVKCDYVFFGIIMIWLFYKFIDDFLIIAILISLIYIIQGEFFGILSIIPIFLYNGRRTNKLMDSKKANIHKYFFYVFYPVHMLILSFF